MKWLILPAVLVAVGCKSPQTIEDEEMFREEYRTCLKDRVELIDKVEVMKVPPAQNCQKPLVVDGGVELGKAAKECLLILEHFGPGAFDEREQAFRTCWDRVDNSKIDELWNCTRDRDDCHLDLKQCRYKLEEK